MQNNLKTCENKDEIFVEEEEKYLEKYKNPLYNILKVTALINKELIIVLE